MILKYSGPVHIGSGGSSLVPVHWVHQNMAEAPSYIFRICQMKSMQKGIRGGVLTGLKNVEG